MYLEYLSLNDQQIRKQDLEIGQIFLSNYKFRKPEDLTQLVGLFDATGIDVDQPIWLLSDVSSKTG